MPQWSTARALAFERLEVPQMVTAPARRRRPNPVPARSLEPLPKLDIQFARRTLTNGVVVRVARGTRADAALRVRLSFGGAGDPVGEEGLALFAARLVASDSGLAALAGGTGTALGGATSIANEGVFDLRVHVSAGSVTQAAQALARALGTRTYTAAQVGAERATLLSLLAGAGSGNAGRGGGGRGGDVAARAQRIVIEAVAPAWRVVPRFTEQSLARITAGDVRTFLARHVVGGAVIVSIVAPLDTAASLAAAADAFSGVPPGKGPARVPVSRTQSLPVRRGVGPLATSTDVSEERIAAASETQVTIVAGLPSVASDHPDRRALELLTYIVGLPQYGGRMGWALTRGGLAYSSGAATTAGVNTGFILLNTKADTRNSPAAIQCIREIVEGIGARGAEAWELDEARSFILGRTLLYGPWNDSENETIADALIESESRGEELLDLPAFSRATLAITLEQVNAAARRYYRPELLKVVAIGALPPSGEKSPFAPGAFRASFEP